MKIIHRVSLSPNEPQRTALSSLGLKLIESQSPLVRLVSFDVDESEDAWPKVKALIAEWNPVDFVRTEFTRTELDGASFLQILVTQKGYPQPADDFGFLRETYDLDNYCKECGDGKIQVAPFRMKEDPKWGKKQILQLNWVFDEFFAPPDVWDAVFRPLDIGRSDVLDHRTGKPLQNVVQLIVKNVAASPLAIADYPYEECASCGRRKYLPIPRGFFPPFDADPGGNVCRTQEVFGSGGSAWNATVISGDVYRKMQEKKLTGVTFVPLKNTISS